MGDSIKTNTPRDGRHHYWIFFFFKKKKAVSVSCSISGSKTRYSRKQQYGWGKIQNRCRSHGSSPHLTCQSAAGRAASDIGSCHISSLTPGRLDTKWFAFPKARSTDHPSVTECHLPVNNHSETRLLKVSQKSLPRAATLAVNPTTLWLARPACSTPSSYRIHESFT